MNETAFKSSSWYRAITLTERIASLRTVKHTPNVDVNPDLAGRRIQRWRSQVPFTSDSFTNRLAMDGISEDDLLYLLGEPIERVHDRFQKPPDWLADLDQAFSRAFVCNSLPDQELLSCRELTGFLVSIEPLISQSRDSLQENIHALTRTVSELPFDQRSVEGMLLANLRGQLIRILSRTMVLELNVARLQGLLEGNTPGERFLSFIDHVRRPETAVALLKEYPVLARQLTICINRWADSSLELLQHLSTDWEAIRATFSPGNNPGMLVEVVSVGDTHQRGRSVLIARFSTGFQVVYKPRSMAVDVHFQELLKWLNDRGAQPSFRTLKVLDRGTYGWAEFVIAQGCTSSDQVRRFYQRQGGYLALLYALEATDFHYENLIAVGEHPLLIDLESLFHPRSEGIDTERAAQSTSSTLSDSVLRVGLLPQRRWSTTESEGVDLSGLGSPAGELTPYAVPQWERPGTDEMRLAYKRVGMVGSRNRPTLIGKEVDVLNYTEEITTGFTNIYRLLLKHKKELMSEVGPLARFVEDEVRVILRPTRIYALLLRESVHPDVLRDALDRDRLFDRLWVGVEHRPPLARVISAEREDLLQGDIPIFTTHPGSRDLWTSSNLRITNFLAKSSMAAVQDRMLQLSEHDLAQQLWFARASLASLSLHPDRRQRPTHPLTEPQTVADHEQLVGVARAIGNRLEALALRGKNEISWIGMRHTNKRHWSLAPLGTDLYSGLSGLTLFLFYLGAITRDERYTLLAQAALTTLRRQMERAESSITAIGAFSGWGGMIYMLTHLGVLLEQHELLDEAAGIVERLPALIERDQDLDVIAGAAGCIGSLFSLYSCVPSERTLAAMIQCGDWLIARAQPMSQGIGWTTRIATGRPLTGFSHGAAGIAWALLKLAALTGNERFRATALDAIAYERGLFSPEAGNWPDLRDFDTPIHAKNNDQGRCMTTWCHGAPGIGLARLSSLPYLDTVETRNEIDVALQTTMTQGFGGNHSLCHGDLGNLELLLQADQVLRDRSWHAEVNRLAGSILDRIHQNGWLCGIPLDVESPGLMTGLAGIGYGLLRLAEPQRVPSVLLLEGPQGHRSTIEKAVLSS